MLSPRRPPCLRPTRQIVSPFAPLAETPPGILTLRESEVAFLVACGLTDREIAERLVISKRTAESHVSHILGRLGAHRRSEIAAFVVALLAMVQAYS